MLHPYRTTDHPPDRTPTMNDHSLLTQAVTDLMARYQHAAQTRDVEAFMTLYDPEVQVFDTWGSWSYQGIEAWRRVIQHWFSSMPANELLRVQTDEVRITPGADVAAVTAAFTYQALTADGRELRSMANRLTWVLQRQGSRWCVVHEHTSVPVDTETAKAILQRQPAG
jgi:uncharacterized protein (TIGR02246 family)